jgi:hypothetical protein
MKTICIVTSFLCSTLLFGQEKIQSTKFENKNSVQLDLGGHGMLYSLNYERVIFNRDRFKTAAQVGFSYYPPSANFIDLWLPVSINEIISFGKHHLEVGIGIVPTRSSLRNIPYVSDEWVWSTFLSARIGYRYQKPDGKFLFRAGFTPLAEFNWHSQTLSADNIHPLAGISFGYCF